MHALFETQYKELAIATNTIANRIRSLDVHAPGTFTQFTNLSTLSEDTLIPDYIHMLKNLKSDHEQLIQNARSVFIVAEKAEDYVTLTLITQRLQFHEKTAYILRSFT